jgi:hypothetical protein
LSDTDKKSDDQKFNDTLRRMLETPPNPKKGENRRYPEHPREEKREE